MADVILDPDFIDFVVPTPDYLHLKCPVCLELLLDDPYLVSCCGAHFHGKCLLKPSITRCPMCSSSNFTKMSDKNHQRALASLSTRCLMKQEGCRWEGDLSKLKQHLSKQGDCQHVEMPCSHQCGKKVKRQFLSDHEQNCDMRPIKCKYCDTYQSTWKEVTSTHYSLCSEYPITCPSPLCGEMITRKDYESHVAECTMSSVKCEFFDVCKWTGPRSTLQNHLDSNWCKHLQMVSLSNSQLISEQRKQLESLVELVTYQGKQISKQEEQIKELSEQVSALTTKNKQSTVIAAAAGINVPPAGNAPVSPPVIIKSEPKPKTEQSKHKIEQTSKNKQLHKVITHKTEQPSLKLYDFILKGFSQAKYSDTYMNSPGIYLDPPCPCLEVLVYPCGIRKGKDTHVSVYMHFIPGEFDDKIDWPYKGHIELRLFDHVKHRKSHGKVITLDSKCSSTLESRMKPRDDAGCKGVGCDQFITQTELQRYLYSDQLHFELAYYNC